MGEAKFLFEGTILADGSLEDTSSSTAESMGLPKRNPERNTVGTVGSGKESKHIVSVALGELAKLREWVIRPRGRLPALAAAAACASGTWRPV